MRDEYQRIVDQIAAVKPSDPGAQNKLRGLTDRLKDMREALSSTTLGGKTQLAKDIEATVNKIKDLKPAFDSATQATTDQRRRSHGADGWRW